MVKSFKYTGNTILGYRLVLIKDFGTRKNGVKGIIYKDNFKKVNSKKSISRGK